MTKRLSMRVVLFLTAVLASILCFVASDTQESKLGNVYADADPISNIETSLAYNGFSTYDYLYACVYDESMGTIHVLDIADDYYGDITANLWTTNGVWLASGSMSGLSFNGSGADKTLTPGTYVLEVMWSANGAYASGYVDDVEIEITPCEVNQTYMTWHFDGCQYGDISNWEFIMQSVVYPNINVEGDADEVEIAWFYKDGSDEVEITNTTPIGYYDIYPKLVGANAEWYTLVTEYDDYMMGMRTLDENNPIELQIQKKDIQVVVTFNNAEDLLMYDDGAAEVVNDLYYNVDVLPLFARTDELGIVIEMNGWRDATTFELFENGISELGTYFINTAAFTVVSEDGTVSADNFNIVNSNCKVRINKRIFVINGESTGEYTGSEVIPDYQIFFITSNPGENISNIILPGLTISDSSNLVTEVSDTGSIVLELVDDENYLIDTGMGYFDTTSWPYTVVPGTPTIDFAQVEDWYYREVIDDWSDKVTITISTTDPNEEVEIDFIEWTKDLGSVWHSGMPSEEDIVDMEKGIGIRVHTTYSTNSKFAATYEDFYFDLQKAPIFLRVVNTDFTYDGEEHEPALDNYRYFIYDADNYMNQWSMLRPDIPLDDLLEKVLVDGKYVPHIWTQVGIDAGSYNLLAVIDPALEPYYEIIQNDIFHDIVYDENAVYWINPATLTVDSFTINDITYGDNWYFYEPEVSGYIPNDHYLVNDTWYYNLTSEYASDEEWILVEDATNPLPEILTVGTYYVKYVGKYDNYNTVTCTTSFNVLPKELIFTWYVSEEDYNNGQGGLVTNNDTTLNVATYTYDATAKAPFYVITGMVNGDDAPSVTSYGIRTRLSWDPVFGAINVGEYFIDITEIDNDNYAFPNNYPTVCALFAIEKAIITVTPEEGFTKVYGSSDPAEFTYTLSGVCGSDEPVLTGALDRDGGDAVGTYPIKMGDLSLTNDAVNDNYSLQMCAIPVLFEITKKEITANFINVKKNYTSYALIPDFNGFTGAELGDLVSISFTTGNSIGVGNYEKSFALVGNDAGNYTLSTNVVSFEILPLAVTYTAKVDGNNVLSVEFDNNQHALSVTMTNIQGTDDVAIDITANGTGTSSGIYTASLALVGAKAENYKFADGENQVVWTITKGGVDYTAFINAFTGVTVQYDGQAHTVIKTGNIPAGYTYAYYVANKTSTDYTTTNTPFTNATAVGNYYVEVRFTEDNDHEHVDSIFKDVIIEKRSITIDWNNYIFTYDGQSHLPEIELLNVVAGEEDYVDVVWSISGQVNYTTGIVAKVNALAGSCADNYKLEGQTQVNMVINKRVIKVTIDAKSSNYGDEVVELTSEVTTGSIVAGDEDVYSLVCQATSAKPIGEYPITGEVGDNDNYTVTFKSSVYTINPRPITVTISNKSSIYGEEQVALNAIVAEGIVNGDTNVYGLTCDVNSQSNVGSYPITGIDNGNPNYAITFVNGTYIVLPRPITITYTSTHKEVTYGDEDAWIDLGEEIYNNNYYLSGAFVNNDTISDSLIVFFYTTPNPTGSDISVVVGPETYAGTYYMVVRGNNNNYSFAFNLGDEAYLQVNKRVLTVTADDKNIIYGMAKPTLTVSYENFAFDEDEDALDLDDVVLTTDYNQFDAVGTYEITVSGYAADNYTFDYVNGELTVDVRPIIVTIDNKSSTYGDQTAELTSTVTTGSIVNDDDVYTLDSAASNVTFVGDYTIYGVPSNNANYDVTFIEGTYTITARPITFTIDDKTSVYGNAPVALTAQLTNGSIVNGDSGLYTLICEVTNQSIVDEYAIRGSKQNANYDITFVNGVYTVTVRDIIVTIANKTSVYGNNTVALTSEVTTGSIVNNDDVYTLACQASKTANVGEYAINGVLSNNPNYNVTFVNGTYTITVRPIIVTIDDKTSVFGDAPVALSSDVTTGSIVNNDVNVYDVVCDVTATSPAGNYAITGVKGTNNNYNVTFVNGTYVVTKRASYDTPIDAKEAEANGVDLTDVFKSIDTTDENAKLELEVGEATVEFNKEAIIAIAGSENNTVFKFKELKAGDEGFVKDAAAVFEISLDGIEFSDGKANITVKFVNKAPNGKVAKLYYVDAKGNRTNMNATFKNDSITFSTTHFSTFAVVYELSTLSIILIVLAILVVVGGIVVGILFFLKKKGSNNKDKKVAKKEVKAEAKAEPKAEAKVEPKAEAKAEVKAEPKAEPKKDNK